MSGSFLGDAFGGRGGSNTPGWPMSNILEGLEQLRTQFEQKTASAPRMNKGDVRSARSRTAAAGRGSRAPARCTPPCSC
ncbi:MAG: putative transcriptional regulator [Microbacterium sp.]|nr:putative transcriptional regulator [Microbacterium sp.]